jgi:hypothetical protein
MMSMTGKPLIYRRIGAAGTPMRIAWAGHPDPAVYARFFGDVRATREAHEKIAPPRLDRGAGHPDQAIAGAFSGHAASFFCV